MSLNLARGQPQRSGRRKRPSRSGNSALVDELDRERGEMESDSGRGGGRRGGRTVAVSVVGAKGEGGELRSGLGCRGWEARRLVPNSYSRDETLSRCWMTAFHFTSAPQMRPPQWHLLTAGARKRCGEMSSRQCAELLRRRANCRLIAQCFVGRTMVPAPALPLALG